MTSWFSRFKEVISKTASKFTNKIDKVFSQKKLDQQSIDNLEEILLTSDIGVATTERIIQEFKQHRFNKEFGLDEIKQELAQLILKFAFPNGDNNLPIQNDILNVIMMCGINGNGKTTSIGKLSYYYKQQGYSVAIAACDTFRAAAVEQLEYWSNKTASAFFKGKDQADPASVAYQAVNASITNNTNILFIDTAGRFHNHQNLMDELKKIKNVVTKFNEQIICHTLLTIDATNGQNAFTQVEQFQKIISLDGLVITKLDSTSRAGITVAISEKFKLPIYFIGIGEGLDDVKEFNSNDFVNAMLNIKS